MLPVLSLLNRQSNMLPTETITPSRKHGYADEEFRVRFPDNNPRRFGLALIRAYLGLIHGLEVNIDSLPQEGPAQILTFHGSYLDVPSLMAIDPYWPWTQFPVRQDLFGKPLVGRMLKAWGAYPVSRDGNDSLILRQMRKLYAQGRTLSIAPQGTRTRTGRLGPMDETVVRLTILTARQGIPVYPIAVIGAYEALPPGRILPIPRKIKVLSGGAIDFGQFLHAGGMMSREEQNIGIARIMQSSIAALLPERNRPEPGTPAMWRKEDYVGNPNRRY